MMSLTASCSIGKKNLDIKYNFSTGRIENADDLRIRYLGTPTITICDFKSDGYIVKIDETQTSIVFETETKGEGIKVTKNIDSCVSYPQPVARGDEITYRVHIVQKNSMDTVADFPISVRVGGRWKVDVSTGVNFLFGMQDERYTIENGRAKEVDDNNKFVPTAFSAMTHFYPKQTGQINWGGTFGLGINDNGKVRYLGGLSLMFGDRQRVVFSGGAVLSQKKVRSNLYPDTQIFDGGMLPADFLEDAWKVGGFLGISYNLTSTVK